MNTATRSLLKSYPRAVAHMFRQLNDGRLGLILGAGVSKALGCPDWRQLVSRIAQHPKVEGTVLARDAEGTPLPILAQVLYHHFRSEFSLDRGPEDLSEADLDRIAASSFRDVIHDCLYTDVPEDEKELLEKDQFYKHFVDVVKRSPLTVNYNFDDSLERIMLASRSPEERRQSRGFETVTDSRLQFRSQAGVIYHPNGYLPQSPLEAPAESLVFSEDSFADQLIDTMTGHFASLLHHLSKNTCLLVGVSLEDATLRHLLRQNAKINPGHYHYFVHFLEDHEALDDIEIRARRDANFEVFNLITLFLNQGQLAALGPLLSSDFRDLRNYAGEAGSRVSFTYYLTGVPGVGKTTTSSYFKSLVTYDEWLEPRLPEMGRPHVDLSDEERQKVDVWVRHQISLKNQRLRDDDREKGVGITIVDRCVPDAIAFSKANEQQEKARDILDAISPGEASNPVHPGHVVLLTGQATELAVRSLCRGKTAPAEYLQELQDETRLVYDGPGVTPLDTTTRSVLQVVKEVARIIHLKDYSQCNLQAILERIHSDGLDDGEKTNATD